MDIQVETEAIGGSVAMGEKEQERCDCGMIIYGQIGESVQCNNCGTVIFFEQSAKDLRARVRELEVEK